MKKSYALLLVLAGFLFSWNIQPAYALYRPTAGPPGILEMKLSEFIHLSARDFCLMTDTKMNLRARVSFTMLKMNMKKTVKKNPDMTVGQYLSTPTKQEVKWWLIILVVALVVIFFALANAWKRDWERGWDNFLGGG